MQGPAMWKGRLVVITCSEESETGFYNVVYQKGRKNKPYHAKFKPEGERKQRHLPDSGSATAWEAACKPWPTTRPQRRSFLL